MMKKPRQSINAVPELDEKIRGLRAEISGKLFKIMDYLCGDDYYYKILHGKEEMKQFAGLFDCLNKEFYAFHGVSSGSSDSSDSDDSPKKEGQNAVDLEQERQKAPPEVAELKKDTNLDCEKDEVRENSNLKNQALATCSLSLQQKLHVLGFQKKAADDTIAQQSAHISKLTQELSRAESLNSELGRRNERNKTIRTKLMEQLKRTEKNLKSSKEEVERMRKVIDSKEFQVTIVDWDQDILQLKEAQEKLGSEIGEKINQTLKGMDAFSVKFKEDYGHLVSRIYDIKNELKVAKKWVVDYKTKHDQLKREIARLEEEKDEMEVMQKSIRRLNQSVERGEEKIGELEKMIAKKDEQMKELEKKMSEKERLISSLNKSIASVITTAIRKISKA